jgi:hypothetical protein
VAYHKVVHLHLLDMPYPRSDRPAVLLCLWHPRYHLHGMYQIFCTAASATTLWRTAQQSIYQSHVSGSSWHSCRLNPVECFGHRFPVRRLESVHLRGRQMRRWISLVPRYRWQRRHRLCVSIQLQPGYHEACCEEADEGQGHGAAKYKAFVGAIFDSPDCRMD